MTKKAYFAAGCFWGVEHYFKTLDGVTATTVGYCGGDEDKPTYEKVSAHSTGHAETIEVEYDPEKVSYEKLVKYFFEIHDFSQVNRQGPDIGEQYRSEIFYNNSEEKFVAEKLIQEVEAMGHKVATKVTEFKKFWPAEDYHQDYYAKTDSSPYCHIYTKIWKD